MGQNEPSSPDSLQCDEFPFWSTLQAYGGSLQILVPSIRWVSKAQNQAQGFRKLPKFYGAGQAGTLPAGCDILAEPATTLIPLPTSAFLNVPIPFDGTLDTTWACNRPGSPISG